MVGDKVIERDVYVADTYALIALLTGEKAYVPYQDAVLFTSDFALVELYWFCMRMSVDETVMKKAEKFASVLIYPERRALLYAAQLRLEHKKESLSYADCVGWSLAQQLGVPFLTGDKAFANKHGVAFVR